MNPFDVLEVSQDANPDDIRAAYHRLAKQWHPDRFAGEEKAHAEEKFRQLAEAFAALKDPIKRQSFQTARPQAPAAGAVSAPAGQPAVPATQERTADDWAEESKSALAARQLDQAKGFIQYALRLDPVRPAFHLLLSEILEAEGRDPRGVIRSLETYLKANPKDADALVRLADLYLGQGMQARAQRFLEDAKAIAPKHKRFQMAAEGKSKAQPPASEPAGIMDQLKGLWGKLAGKG
ncbi:MAG TPA: DnaJ domain-containing protein [Holophagaceae bacterium]|nr:DnaJ domain-containing protein [Holophagaceae bacterium]